MNPDDITRVVIRRTIPSENKTKIEYLLGLIKLDLELTKVQLQRNLLTQEKLDKKIKIWDNTYEEISKLAGFDSLDDLNYFTKHFMNNEGDQSK